ncbi:MAG: recombinase family protein, partial [Thermoplasmatota archaeon]
RSSFGTMVDFLRKNPEARIILVEKTDRLYRNLKDWVTLDELDLEIHFVSLRMKYAIEDISNN